MKTAYPFVAASIAAMVLTPQLRCQESVAPHSGQPVDAATLPQDLVVPIHTLPTDPTFGEYGVWAGGLGYKVRFGDDVTFIPRLGRNAPRNLPLTWRTREVRIGAHVLVAADSVSTSGAASPTRFEYRRGPVVEAYDVRADGIEQTFVLATRPSIAGDLVVEGSFVTDLLAQDTAGQHTDLEFVDPTTRRVVASYGHAFVLDALGRKEPICTTFTDGVVRLCVPSTFLARAVFPVTIDPLTSPQFLNLDGYSSADVGTQDESSNQTQLVAYSLWTSSTDIDMLVFSYTSNWTSAQLFADLNDGWHSNHPAIAYSDGANRWIVAFERQSAASQIRLYLHNRDNTAFNSGQLVHLSRMATNSHDWKADVGTQAGTSNTLALVVCQSEFGTQFNTTGVSEVYGRLVDVATGQTTGVPLPLAGSVSSIFDREGPTVTVATHGTFYWQTAWSQGTTASMSSIYTAQVDSDGTVRAAVRIDDPGQSFQKVLARIDGRNGDFLVTYTLADVLGREYGRFLQGTRFRNLYPRIADVRHRTIVTAGANETLTNTGLAFDRSTSSHWAVAWHSGSSIGVPSRVFVARVGYEAVITEMHALTNQGEQGSHPVVAFSAARARFLVVNSQFNALMGRDFLYPSDAGTTVVGPGCGGSTISAVQPYAGNANFYLHLGTAPAGQSAVALLSFGQSSVPLAFLGMVGCTLHLNPATLVSLPPTSVTFLNAALVNLPLPDSFFGDLYAQWWFSDPQAPGGARVSPALRIRVR